MVKYLWKSCLAVDGSKYHTSSIAYRSDQQHNAKKQTSAQSMQRNKSQKTINAGYLYMLDRLAQYKHTSMNDWVAQIMPFSILLASTFIRRVTIPQQNNQCYRYIELLLFFLMHLHKHEEELMLQKPGFVVKKICKYAWPSYQLPVGFPGIYVYLL